MTGKGIGGDFYIMDSPNCQHVTKLCPLLFLQQVQYFWKFYKLNNGYYRSDHALTRNMHYLPSNYINCWNPAFQYKSDQHRVAHTTTPTCVYIHSGHKEKFVLIYPAWITRSIWPPFCFATSEHRWPPSWPLDGTYAPQLHNRFKDSRPWVSLLRLVSLQSFLKVTPQ